jgi:divalent metal cation (Fe/Co/Zn/Cd) transporter
VFFNIMSLSFPAIGQWLKSPLLDPIGGMVLSVYIIWQWCLVRLFVSFVQNLTTSMLTGYRVLLDAA